MDIFRGAEREPGLEQWRRLAALYGPLLAGRTTAGRSCHRRKASQMDDLSHTIQASEILEQRHRERTGDQLPQDMRLVIFALNVPHRL